MDTYSLARTCTTSKVGEIDGNHKQVCHGLLFQKEIIWNRIKNLPSKINILKANI